MILGQLPLLYEKVHTYQPKMFSKINFFEMKLANRHSVQYDAQMVLSNSAGTIHTNHMNDLNHPLPGFECFNEMQTGIKFVILELVSKVLCLRVSSLY